MKKASNKEKKNAYLWCISRLKELPETDPNYIFFKDAKEDISKSNIRYSIREQSGLHIDVLRAFSKAYLKKKETKK